MSTVLK